MSNGVRAALFINTQPKSRNSVSVLAPSTLLVRLAPSATADASIAMVTNLWTVWSAKINLKSRACMLRLGSLEASAILTLAFIWTLRQKTIQNVILGALHALTHQTRVLIVHQGKPTEAMEANASHNALSDIFLMKIVKEITSAKLTNQKLLISTTLHLILTVPLKAANQENSSITGYKFVRLVIQHVINAPQKPSVNPVEWGIT
jgi:hypothetical protein